MTALSRLLTYWAPAFCAGPYWIDPRSSGPWFDGWRGVGDGTAPPSEGPPTAEPQTWLLSTGWRRAGLIRVDEVPSAAFT